MRSSIIAIIFSLSLCNSTRDVNMSLVEEKVKVDLGDNVVSTTFFWHSVTVKKEDITFLFIDELFNLIELDLTNKNLVNVLSLANKQGPNVIKGGVRSPSLGIGDQYLIEGPFQFYSIDQYGVFQDTYDFQSNILDKVKSDFNEISKGLFVQSRGGNFMKNNKLILSIGRSDKFGTDEYPKFPQFALVELSNNEFKTEILNIFFPEELVSNDLKYMGQFEIPNYFFDGEWLVYNYSSFRQIYFFNTITGENHSLSLDSGVNIQDKAIPFGEIPTETIIKYGLPLVDFSKKIIYRYHIVIEPGKPMENSNYLTAYDFKGKVIAENFLGKNSERMLRNSVLAGDYVYMNNFFQSSDDWIEFSRFSLK